MLRFHEIFTRAYHADCVYTHLFQLTFSEAYTARLQDDIGNCGLKERPQPYFARKISILEQNCSAKIDR